MASTLLVIHVEGDLFDSLNEEGFRGSDGHQLATTLESQVCNWLYLAQLAHAYQRRLPVEEELQADFYLPGATVYIECWEEDMPADRLSAKLAKQEVFRREKLKVIDIHQRDSQALDRVLGEALRELGIRW